MSRRILHSLTTSSSPATSCSIPYLTPPSIAQVLLEWEGDGKGKGRREWVNLSDTSKCQAVYMESKLLWAKRLITVDQQRRAVAWPSKVSRAQFFVYGCSPQIFRMSISPPPKHTQRMSAVLNYCTHML